MSLIFHVPGRSSFYSYGKQRQLCEFSNHILDFIRHSSIPILGLILFS